ncbi:hypothetical protein ATO12_23295 [Aquimarina atlantica]|uniref:Uncharacterized protein n=1 Tax=Aquimarina atlantica TaxID=1317122 RepID=A0A023BQN4_9FLAO|nr:hypothetical protein [Aquimarina atlantica]EZH72380.1 hypothetical protein ATO12_23295 [Aquimarina atlantica]
MDKVLYILVFIGLFSCKSNSIAQEKESDKNEKPKIENPRAAKPKIKMPGLGDPRDNEITHGEFETDNLIEANRIDLVGLFIKFYKDKKICDKAYKNAIEVKLDKVIRSGSGIIKSLSEQQEITLVFMKFHNEDVNVLKQKLVKDQKISFQLRERPCFDSSKSVYEIITFKIKN